MKRLLPAACLSCLVCLPALAAPPLEVERSTIYADPARGIVVAGGEVTLDRTGWQVDPGRATPGLSQLVLTTSPSGRAGYPPSGEDLSGGRRIQAYLRDRRVEEGRHRLQNFSYRLTEYAAEHGGMTPSSRDELAAWAKAKKQDYWLQELENSPWYEDREKKISGPFWLIVPGIPWAGGPPANRPPGNAAPATVPAVPVVLELRPWVDDGRTWVLLSDGTVERRPADRELLAKLGAVLRPVNSADASPAPATSVIFRLAALVTGEMRGPVGLTLRHRPTGDTREVRWDLSTAAVADQTLLADWTRGRALAWAGYPDVPGSVLSCWRSLPGTFGGQPWPGDPGRTEGAGMTDWVSFLGGRAAIQETLQTQLAGRPAKPETAGIPVTGIAGVEVQSHPFEDMLGGQEGGRISLADAVPPDRFFAWFARPDALLPFLDQGADFLFRAGSVFSQSSIDDDLKGRYLARFGLDDKLLRKLLESGQVVELALATPDLFLLDGSDLTVILRVKKPEKAAKGLASLGIVELKGEEIATRNLADGRQVSWVRKGDLIVVSSHRGELDAVLGLVAAGGEGSLGRSAEFRYMLTRLPPGKGTRMLAYLSDPFIRRMTGPAVKIGQMRRAAAVAAMERFLAGSLLARVDGRGDLPPERLVSFGYVPQIDTAEYSLGPDLVPISRTWGRLPALRTLGENPVSLVTPSEAESYKRYKESYTRYWRQYFDPVALRLDDGKDDSLALEIFILPLLESQLYGTLRDFIGGDAADGQLLRPVAADPAVLTLSFNLGEKGWTSLAGSMGRSWCRTVGLDPAIMDIFGPGIHLAIRDGDPVIAQGNGDLLGSLGTVGVGGWRAERFLFPALISILTRPCSVYVQIQDPDAMLTALRATSARVEAGRGGMSSASLQRIEGRDAWLLTLNFERIARIRLGIEVKGGFLVLSNLPWSSPDPVARVERGGLDMAGLTVRPGAVTEELAALWMTDGEERSRASRRGMGLLYPFLLSGVADDVDQATLLHRRIYGYTPVHPGPGKWTWRDGRLESSVFGGAVGGHLPAWKKAKPGDFGLFAGIDWLSADLRFEETGLRTLLRWRLADDD